MQATPSSDGRAPCRPGSRGPRRTSRCRCRRSSSEQRLSVGTCTDAADRIAAVDRCSRPHHPTVERRAHLAVERRVARLGPGADVRRPSQRLSVRHVAPTPLIGSQLSSVQATPSSTGRAPCRPGSRGPRRTSRCRCRRSSSEQRLSVGTCTDAADRIAAVDRCSRPHHPTVERRAHLAVERRVAGLGPGADVRRPSQRLSVRHVAPTPLIGSQLSSPCRRPRHRQVSGVPAWQSRRRVAGLGAVADVRRRRRVPSVDHVRDAADRIAAVVVQATPSSDGPAPCPPGSRAPRRRSRCRCRRSASSQSAASSPRLATPLIGSQLSSPCRRPRHRQVSAVPAWQSRRRVAGLGAVADVRRRRRVPSVDHVRDAADRIAAVVVQATPSSDGPAPCPPGSRAPRRRSRCRCRRSASSQSAASSPRLATPLIGSQLSSPCRRPRHRQVSAVPAWQSRRRVAGLGAVADVRRRRRVPSVDHVRDAADRIAAVVVQATPSSDHQRRARLAVERRVAGLGAVADVRRRRRVQRRHHASRRR